MQPAEFRWCGAVIVDGSLRLVSRWLGAQILTAPSLSTQCARCRFKCSTWRPRQMLSPGGSRLAGRPWDGMAGCSWQCAPKFTYILWSSCKARTGRIRRRSAAACCPCCLSSRCQRRPLATPRRFACACSRKAIGSWMFDFVSPTPWLGQVAFTIFEDAAAAPAILCQMPRDMCIPGSKKSRTCRRRRSAAACASPRLWR